MLSIFFLLKELNRHIVVSIGYIEMEGGTDGTSPTLSMCDLERRVPPQALQGPNAGAAAGRRPAAAGTGWSVQSWLGQPRPRRRQVLRPSPAGVSGGVAAQASRQGQDHQVPSSCPGHPWPFLGFLPWLLLRSVLPRVVTYILQASVSSCVSHRLGVRPEWLQGF